MSDNQIELIAHLMRRAGFGASREELTYLAEKGYSSVVSDLVSPTNDINVDEDLLLRYYGGEAHRSHTGKWVYRMLNNPNPLIEKVALFWHHIFATGITKVENPYACATQIETFRNFGMGKFDTLLLNLSKDPAMIFWLDNNENRTGEPNENYGRELLELFSMGVGNYTEFDLKECARAFTGWTFTQPLPRYPVGDWPSFFEFRSDAHDHGEKQFLGHVGNFNGEDIIEIIAKQPATALFLARHMYNFFVADEPQVPAWPHTPCQDPDALDELVKSYFASGGNIASMLETLFNSDFFKKSQGKKIKSPTELMLGILKLSGTYKFPEPGMNNYWSATDVMGQEIFNPPTVEGWHTGKEWIDGGTLNERINFATTEVSNLNNPGIKFILHRITSNKQTMSPVEVVDQILDLSGAMVVGESTKATLMECAEEGGDFEMDNPNELAEINDRIIQILQLAVASREYQFA